MAFEDAKHLDSVLAGPVDHDVVTERDDSDTFAKVRPKFAHLGLRGVELHFLFDGIKEPVGSEWTVMLDTNVVVDAVEVRDCLDVSSDSRH